MSAQPNKLGKGFGNFVGFGFNSMQQQRPGCHIDRKALVESMTTGILTINNVQNYCRWQIDNKLTQEACIKAFNEGKEMFLRKAGDKPTMTVTVSSSSTATENGVTTHSSQNSSTTTKSAAAIQYSFFVQLGEVNLYVSTTPFPSSEPIIKLCTVTELHQNSLANAYPELNKPATAAAKK